MLLPSTRNHAYRTTRRINDCWSRRITTKTWQRTAKRVQNLTDQDTYLDAIRETHDPAWHIKTLEEELQSTIGQALGKQGQKILDRLQELQRAYEQYQQLNDDACERRQIAERYNAIRNEAIQARWELMVHRQAAGFLVNNHKFVTDSYPIPPALVVTEEGGDVEGEAAQVDKKKKKVMGDQLDWWQRIGRWR